jgi:hypothetical protein
MNKKRFSKTFYFIDEYLNHTYLEKYGQNPGGKPVLIDE